jgi:hypothetical protein
LARRKGRKKSILENEFARPVGALVLLGLLYLAFRVGLLAWIAEIPIDILRDGYGKT